MKKPNLCINFSTLKKGGGLNVSMNFLHAFDKVESPFKIFFMVADSSPQHIFLINKGFTDFFVVPNHPIKRILWEICIGWAILKKYKIDIIYSYFGFAFFIGRVKQVTGSADSNLYFPEVDFWEGCTGLQKLKKSFVDYYRLYCVKKASGVVYENKSMLERGVSLHRLKNVVFIKPSIKTIAPTFCSREFNFGKGFVALFLCDWHVNKNVSLIPDLLKVADDLGFDLKIAISAKYNDSKISNDVKSRIESFGLQHKFFTLGSINKDDLYSLYSSVDAVLLLSKLESFSNNIIEAWAFQKPLVVADEEWSRAICNEAAFYVPRCDIYSIVDTLRNISLNNSIVTKFNGHALAELSNYPTVEQRIKQEYDFLLEIIN